ncbi:MAG: hypothetical protein R3B41_03885 [Candidatus Doudnabacteria bacterium]
MAQKIIPLRDRPRIPISIRCNEANTNILVEYRMDLSLVSQPIMVEKNKWYIHRVFLDESTREIKDGWVERSPDSQDLEQKARYLIKEFSPQKLIIHNQQVALEGIALNAPTGSVVVTSPADKLLAILQSWTTEFYLWEDVPRQCTPLEPKKPILGSQATSG